MENLDSNQLTFAGDVQVKSAKIMSYNGLELDIINLINQVDIYEDIYSPFLTIDLMINDTLDLIDSFPMIGEEVLILTIEDATGLGFKEKMFSVYKIKDRVPTADKAFAYTMCTISIEAIVDLNTRISKSFKGLPHNIANDLLKNIGLQTDKDIHIEESSNNIQYISNYWSVIENLEFLAARSISKNSKSPSYIFFESLSGFNFVSEDTLVQQDSSSRFTYSNRKNNDISSSFERIAKLYIDEDFDYITRLKTGMYGNRLLLVNPFAKSYNYRYMDFLYMYDKMSRLNTSPIANEDATRRTNSALVTKNVPSGSFTSMKSEGTSNWYQQRQIELASREAQSIQVDVPGRFNVDVGQVTEVYVYSESIKPADAGPRDMYTALDKVHSGRYLVSGIHRIINRSEGHHMSLRLTKDSLIDNK